MATRALVTIQNNQPLTTSLIIAVGTNNEHESIMRIIQRYEEKFKRWGEIYFSDLKSGNKKGDLRGRPIQIAYLNEPQAAFLLTLLRNNDIVVDFKSKLVDQFYKMRQKLLTPEEAERLKIRQAGKTNRRTLTDAIKPFVEEERPKSSGLYFAMPTKFIQTALCGIPKGGRDEATGQQLLICAALETAAANTFEQSYHQDKNFNQAFHDAKKTATFLRSVFNGAVPALHHG